MKAVSSSFSVYQGPPVIATEGSRWAIMYVFLVRCYASSTVKVLATCRNTHFDIGDGFYDLLLHQSFQTSINNSLVKVRLGFEVLCPDPYLSLSILANIFCRDVTFIPSGLNVI